MKTITQKKIERKNVEQTFTGDIYNITVKDGILFFRTVSEFNDFFSKIVGLSDRERKAWEKKVGYRSMYTEFIEFSMKHTPETNLIKRLNSSSAIVKKNPFGNEYLEPNVFLWEYSYIVNSIGDISIQGVKFNVSTEGIYNYESRRKVRVSIEPEEQELITNPLIESGQSKRSNNRITYSGYDPNIIRFFGLNDLYGNTGNIQNIYDENHPNPHPSAGGSGWGPNYGWYPKLWKGQTDTWKDINLGDGLILTVQTKMFFNQNQINGLQVKTISGVYVRLFYKDNNQLFDWPEIRKIRIYGNLNNGNFIYHGSKPVGGVSTSWYQQTSPNSGVFVNDLLFKFSNGDLGGNNVYAFKDYSNVSQNQRPSISTVYFPNDANFGIISTKGLPYYDYCSIKVEIVYTEVIKVPNWFGSGYKVEKNMYDFGVKAEVFDGMVLY